MPVDEALFKELTKSVHQVGEVRRGRRKPSRRFEFGALDVKDIREKTGLSQSRFALLIGVSIRTLQNWEQGRRKPQGPAASLLKIVKSDPKGSVKALHE